MDITALFESVPQRLPEQGTTGRSGSTATPLWRTRRDGSAAPEQMQPSSRLQRFVLLFSKKKGCGYLADFEAKSCEMPHR